MISLVPDVFSGTWDVVFPVDVFLLEKQLYLIMLTIGFHNHRDIQI